MNRTTEHADLLHAANNCAQMLQALDRRLEQALVALDDGNLEDCRETLAFVKQALPEAIASISHDCGP